MVTFCFTRRKNTSARTSGEDEHEDVRFCLFISGCLAFTTQAWVHYYVVLILPYYLLLISLVKNDFKISFTTYVLFTMSFACIHGNIFLMKSTRLFELFEYLGLFYWANIFLFLSLILYLNRQRQLSKRERKKMKRI